MPYCANCGSELPDEAVYCPKCGTSVEPLAKPKLAYWSERFVAWLIDIVILNIILAPIRLFIWITWPSFVWAPGLPVWIPFVDFGLANVMYFLYWMLMEGTYGQSIGKMIMRIRVTQLGGKPVNMVHAARESVGKAFLLPIDCLLGWLLYPMGRQRIFNHMSGTAVVKTLR